MTRELSHGRRIIPGMDPTGRGARPWWLTAPTEDDQVPPQCGVCGVPLPLASAVIPSATGTGLCDECIRAREFDQTLWELDLADPDDGLW